MSFKHFIYYCALCGAWAAFVAGILVMLLGLHGRLPSEWKMIVNTTVTGAILGVLLALTVGTLDALLNSVGSQRVVRPLVAVVVGLVGGMLGGMVGEVLYQFTPLPRFPGWVLAGMAIGASIGVFDLARAATAGSGMGLAVRKLVNGLIGGFMGGLVGGILYDLLTLDSVVNALATKRIDIDKDGVAREVTEGYVFTRTSLALGLVILGACVGLLIGLAQVILKEAWVRVEAGFRSGRELILSKADTSIGRAESCDIGLYGDNGIEKLHARILLKGNRYLLADDETPGGTFLNGERINGPTPLRSGDRIGVGRAVLRFGERQKR